MPVASCTSPASDPNENGWPRPSSSSEGTNMLERKAMTARSGGQLGGERWPSAPSHRRPVRPSLHCGAPGGARGGGRDEGTGEQARQIQQHLKNNPDINLVWYDFCSMPQNSKRRGLKRTAVERIMFKTMLPNINLLYLGCQVLILMDRSYMSRFWTQFEAYLSMRVISARGLASAENVEKRITIMLVHDAQHSLASALKAEWNDRSPQEAHKVSPVHVSKTDSFCGILPLTRSLSPEGLWTCRL